MPKPKKKLGFFAKRRQAKKIAKIREPLDIFCERYGIAKGTSILSIKEKLLRNIPKKEMPKVQTELENVLRQIKSQK